MSALLDMMLLYILRTWLREQAGNGRATGWAATLSDPAIAATLRHIHGQPARQWTVEALGAEAGLSRAAFSRRFTSLVGKPPLSYLTWWRMTLAAQMLRDSDRPVQTVAQRTGYTSEFAFAKAFKREHGVALAATAGRCGRRSGTGVAAHQGLPGMERERPQVGFRNCSAGGVHWHTTTVPIFALSRRSRQTCMSGAPT
ncbi:helix-turn-helix transcriptional regulator [Catellatospora coxensis]